MDEYRYLFVMVACLTLALPLEWLLRARVVRRPRRWLASLVPAVVVFVTWDAVAIARDERQFSDLYLTGLTMSARVPVEELVYFVVVPTCALLVYEAVGTALTWWHGDAVGVVRSDPGQRGDRRD